MAAFAPEASTPGEPGVETRPKDKSTKGSPETGPFLCCVSILCGEVDCRGLQLTITNPPPRMHALGNNPQNHSLLLNRGSPSDIMRLYLTNVNLKSHNMCQLGCTK
nr:uncharacterized protein LOC106827473 [Equus asinus]